MNDLHQRIAASFNAQGLMATLGARLVRVQDGEVQINMPFAPGTPLDASEECPPTAEPLPSGEDLLGITPADGSDAAMPDAPAEPSAAFQPADAAPVTAETPGPVPAAARKNAKA